MIRPILHLASRSPRRAELLRTLGVDFAIIDVDVDETPHSGESPPAYVRRLALAKAAAGRARVAAGAPVLAADTTVVVDDDVLGKPRDGADAARMLAALSGRWHAVFTGVALDCVAAADAHGLEKAAVGAIDSVVVATRVLFRTLRTDEIARYWASGEPADKAGAYAVQGLGGAFVRRLDGSFSNVVGLPLAETLALLERARIPHHLAAP
jgi:septum formation protein